MVSLIEALTVLDKLEHIEKWISYFTMLARVKKSKDVKPSRGENEITDLFLVLTDCETVKKILTMAYSKELEQLTYKEILRIFKKTDQKETSCC